ncbi:MAG: 2-C-methyl-D-erythritol 4-phosphate cytidylyltransferase, partial [Desulfovibrio sp.]|nr:2-C-methyl-D-erythritol 4-phosphate cytidylyltransferase [Desulfovibrio sp.]
MPESSIPPPGHNKPWVILLAAGQGSRLAAATKGNAKQFISWRGAPLFWHAARAVSRSAAVAGIVFVFPKNEHAAHKDHLRELHAAEDLGLPWLTAAGGELRQDSVWNGLCVLPAGTRHVLVHDAARPFVTPTLIRKVCEALQQDVAGVIPALPVTDTIKTVADGLVSGTLPRQTLVAAQTPQGFSCELLRQAHFHAQQKKFSVTDDAALLEALGHKVHIVEGG